MERAAFLIEDGGTRIPCLLNPAAVVMRRVSGIAPRAANGPVTGTGLADVPLSFTGGGWTELRLDLLFDVTLVSGPDRPATVRRLTEPLWRLAENRPRGDDAPAVPLVRFVWGKSWNVPGVIAAVAERLEQFSIAGAPQRSWMRLLLLRVVDRPASEPIDETSSPADPEPWMDWPSAGPGGSDTRELVAGGEAGDRVDLIAGRACGGPARWRWVAEASGLDDPLRIRPGTVLSVPAAGGARIA